MLHLCPFKVVMVTVPAAGYVAKVVNRMICCIMNDVVVNEL